MLDTGNVLCNTRRTMREKDDKQIPPLSVRLWAENAAWFADFQKIYSTTNAAINIALMRAQGLGDIKIDEECKKHMRIPK